MSYSKFILDTRNAPKDELIDQNKLRFEAGEIFNSVQHRLHEYACCFYSGFCLDRNQERLGSGKELLRNQTEHVQI